MRTMVGREHELATVETLLDCGLEQYSALLLSGEAGIGKTTVWQEAVRLGEEAGFRVLRCRPGQAEAKLGFAALSDLLSSVDQDAFSALPEPQRDAVDAALLRAAPRAAGSASRAVAAGLLSVLRGIAQESPVLVAIDDVQWLDRPSEGALAFALRRLDPAMPVALVTAQRIDGKAPTDPLGFADLPASQRERVVLGPLSLSALYHVIHAKLGIVVPRRTLQRIAAASGGNPLLAIELARALAETGARPGPGEPLPVPDETVDLLASRIQKLPERAQEAMLASALLSDPRIELLERALGSSAGESLERAREADLVEVRGDRIRFAHPLVGAVLESSVLPTKRRAMHRRLAEVAPSAEERARHLALGCEGPDEAVAASLEEAAGLAGRRGAPQDASELLELAWRLTPDDDTGVSGRRRFELALALVLAGDHVEAIALLDGLLGEDTTGPLRARALELRGRLHWETGIAREGEACCEEALEHVGDDDALRARVLVTLARLTRGAELPLHRSRAAVDLLESLDDPDPGLLAEALVPLAGAEYYLGHGSRSDVVERALELERISPTPIVADRMSAALGTWLKYDGDFEGARHWLEVTRQSALDEGDEGSLPYALSHLPQLDLWTGDWAQSEARALEHLELAETTRQTSQRLTAIFSLAVVHAHQGRVDETRERLAQALGEAEQGDPWNVYQLLSALGFLDLSIGSATEAVPSLARAYEIYEASGAGDTPSVFENYAEALVLVGDVDTAEAGRRGVRTTSTEGREGNHPCPRASLPRPRPRRAGKARRVTCVARGSARPARARRHAVQPCPHPSRPRAGVAPPRRATSSTRCPRAGPVDLRGTRRAALGRARSRGAGTSPQQAFIRVGVDPSGVARRRAGGRRKDEPRGRANAVREREDRRGQPHPHLPQARYPLARCTRRSYARREGRAGTAVGLLRLDEPLAKSLRLVA